MFEDLKAEESIKQSIAIRKKVFGDFSVEIAEALHILA